MQLWLDAPAKINLTLRVLGQRPDGYHEIESCMQALVLADALGAQRAADIRLEVHAESATGHVVPTGPDNLVWRAALAFRRATGVAGGATFVLHKRIPAGAGLGGGSSNAAAALLLLNELYGKPLGAAALHEVGASLGADVPFFLRGGTQIARGIGERLEVVSSPPHFHLLLIAPPFGTSTAAVYKNWSASLTAGSTLPRIPQQTGSDQGSSVPYRTEEFVNDLERSAMQLHPELSALADRIRQEGFAQVRMSGSGSTLFLAFDVFVQALQARDTLSFLRAERVSLLLTESMSAAAESRRPVRRDGGISRGDTRGGGR